MDAYPLLVRKRIIELYHQNKTTKQIAELFGISRSGTRRVKQRHRESGSFAQRPHAGGRTSKLTPRCQQRIRDFVAADPDATREELKKRLKLNVSLQSISRWLIQLDLTLKKSRSLPPSRTGRTSRPDGRSGIRTSDAFPAGSSSSSTNRRPGPT